MFIIPRIGTMAVPVVSEAAGAPEDFSEAGQGSAYIELSGSFVGSYKIEGSINNGLTWTDLGGLFFNVTTGSPAGSAIAAPALFGYFGQGRPPQKMRWKNVAYTSGTPVSHYSFRAPL